MSKESCLWLNHVIKQTSFPFSSNMNFASHLVDYISVHIRFDMERYLLDIHHAEAFKYSAKKCLNTHIPFNFIDDSTLANQGAGKQ